MSTMNPITKALLTLVLDEQIRTFLSLNDPKALEQALCACKLVDDIPRETQLKLNEIAEEHVEVKKAKPAKGNLVLVLGVDGGRFAIRERGNKTLECDLNAGALARMLVKAGYDATNENHVLSNSSSIDFPEEDGAPKGFDAHAIVQRAILLSMRVR